jgi:hypothetical protein
LQPKHTRALKRLGPPFGALRHKTTRYSCRSLYMAATRPARGAQLWISAGLRETAMYDYKRKSGSSLVDVWARALCIPKDRLTALVKEVVEEREAAHPSPGPKVMDAAAV